MPHGGEKVTGQWTIPPPRPRWGGWGLSLIGALAWAMKLAANEGSLGSRRRDFQARKEVTHSISRLAVTIPDCQGQSINKFSHAVCMLLCLLPSSSCVVASYFTK